MHLRVISSICLLLVMLAGCSSNNNQTYDHDEVNRIQTTLTGTIESLEVVNVSGTSSWKGTLTGSILGGVLGSTIGNGWGRVISSAAGSIAGGFAGAGVEQQLTKDEGLKMSIRGDNGNKFSVVVVPNKDQSFKVGDKVKVISSSSGTIQVYHM